MTNPAPVSDVLCSPWATPTDIPDSTRTDLPTVTDEQWVRYLTFASEILWALSGRRWYGTGCTEVAETRTRPDMPGTGTWPNGADQCCWGWWKDWVWWGYPAVGTWRGQQASPMAFQLPRQPIGNVTSVQVNGQDFAGWRLTGSGWLERIDGQPWSTCDTTVTVTYEWGVSPPSAGRDAVVSLATEFAKNGAGLDCALPERVSQITRQGISMAFLDPMDFLPAGRTGVYPVDLWLASVNPKGRGQRGSVWSPDVPTSIRM